VFNVPFQHKYGYIRDECFSVLNTKSQGGFHLQRFQNWCNVSKYPVTFLIQIYATALIKRR